MGRPSSCRGGCSSPPGADRRERRRRRGDERDRASHAERVAVRARGARVRPRAPAGVALHPLSGPDGCRSRLPVAADRVLSLRRCERTVTHDPEPRGQRAVRPGGDRLLGLGLGRRPLPDPHARAFRPLDARPGVAAPPLAARERLSGRDDVLSRRRLGVPDARRPARLSRRPRPARPARCRSAWALAWSSS